jgi:dTDP-4-dehydrorhamnose reductase
MILLIGGTGWIGQAFARELSLRKLQFHVLSRRQMDYTKFDLLRVFLEEQKPDFIINAAGFCGTPNVDECESRQAETLLANTILPATIANACASNGLPWIHVSSGCIFDDASPDGAWTERDTPNFSFDNERHSFYSASKELGERVICPSIGNCYICRLRMPFSETSHPKNLLTKLQNYSQIYDSPPNSLSHLGECVRACIGLWETGAAPGTYNVVNPGQVANWEIVQMIRDILKPNRDFCWWEDEETFYRVGAKAQRSNCVLSPSKALAAGAKLRDAREAIEDSLRNWKAAS